MSRSPRFLSPDFFFRFFSAVCNSRTWNLSGTWKLRRAFINSHQYTNGVKRSRDFRAWIFLCSDRRRVCFLMDRTHYFYARATGIAKHDKLSRCIDVSIEPKFTVGENLSFTGPRVYFSFYLFYPLTITFWRFVEPIQPYTNYNIQFTRVKCVTFWAWVVSKLFV